MRAQNFIPDYFLKEFYGIQTNEIAQKVAYKIIHNDKINIERRIWLIKCNEIVSNISH